MARYLPFLPVDESGHRINDPLSQYTASDIDDAADPQYFGYLGVNGEWYIKKLASIVGGTTIRYAKGENEYRSTWWTNRASIGFDDFDVIF